MFARVNLEWYRTFKAIYRMGTLTGAAQELFITQPNASQHLSALESYMGGKLFERTARRMIPTEQAKRLYVQLVEPLEKIEQIEARFRKNARPERPTLLVGVPHEFFVHRFIPILSLLDFSLQVRFGLTEHLLADLEKGHLNAVVATQKLSKFDVVFSELMTETLLLVGSPDLDSNPFQACVAQGDLLGAEAWLSRQDWLAYATNLPLIRRFWQVNFNKRPSLTARYVIPDLNAIVAAIGRGGGISLVPDYLCHHPIRQGVLQLIWEDALPVNNVLYLAVPRRNTYVEQTEQLRRTLLAE